MQNCQRWTDRICWDITPLYSSSVWSWRIKSYRGLFHRTVRFCTGCIYVNHFDCVSDFKPKRPPFVKVEQDHNRSTYTLFFFEMIDTYCRSFFNSRKIWINHIIFSKDYTMMGPISKYSFVSPENDYGTGSLAPNGSWTAILLAG